MNGGTLEARLGMASALAVGVWWKLRALGGELRVGPDGLGLWVFRCDGPELAEAVGQLKMLGLVKEWSEEDDDGVTDVMALTMEHAETRNETHGTRPVKRGETLSEMLSEMLDETLGETRLKAANSGHPKPRKTSTERVRRHRSRINTAGNSADETPNETPSETHETCFMKRDETLSPLPPSSPPLSSPAPLQSPPYYPPTPESAYACTETAASSGSMPTAAVGLACGAGEEAMSGEDSHETLTAPRSMPTPDPASPRVPLPSRPAVATAPPEAATPPTPKPPASRPPATEPPLLVFPCHGNVREWGLPPSKLAEWAESFPGLDVMAEMRVARQWCLDNPTKQKTARGMPAFLGRWLGRAQNRGGRRIADEDEPPASYGPQATERPKRPTSPFPASVYEEVDADWPE